MSTNYVRLCEARDKAHPMTPDTMIEIRAIDLHAVLVNYAVMAEKMEALQSANKDLMAHFEAARADAEKWEARFGVVNEQRAMARETLLDLRHDLREQAERTESSEAAMFRYFHGIVDDLLGFSDVEQWDAVHEALGKPSKLGESKAEASMREIDRMRTEIAALKDPSVVLVNMMRGNIATPSPAALADLFGANLTDLDAVNLRIAELSQALRKISEGNLGDRSWQGNYDAIRAIACNALGVGT